MRAFAAILIAAAIFLPSALRSEVLSSDDQIRKALVGNTISGEEEGEPYTEFINPDGRILGEDRQGRYSGHWMISGAQMCMRYFEQPDKEGEWDCSRVEMDGSQITWTSGGEKSVSKLTRGNPSKF